MTRLTTDEKRNESETSIFTTSTYIPEGIWCYTSVLDIRIDFVFEISETSPLFLKAAKQTAMLTLSSAAGDSVSRSTATLLRLSPLERS